MGILSNQELSREETIQVLGRSYTLRTDNKEKLKAAAKWVNERLGSLSEQHPLLKTADLQTLLLLELGMERIELKEEGKSLLKQSDQLLEWLSIKTT